MIFRTIDSGIKSTIAFCSLSVHSRIHGICRGCDIFAGVVHDILCIVCDSATLSDVRDIFRSLLRFRGRARRIRDFRHGRTHGIDLMVLILPILVLNLEAILFRSDFRIGLVAVLVSRIAFDAFCGLARIGAISLRIIGFGFDTICLHIRTGFCPVGRVALLRIGFAALFRMGKLALRGHTALFHLSVMSDTVCGNRSRAIMNRTIRVRIGVFHGNLVRLELALDFEILLHGHLLFERCFAFHGQFVIERGLASDTERAADLGILELRIARSELTFYGSRFQLRIPIGHVQTVTHIHHFMEIRGSVYRHRVRPIRRAEGDVAFKVRCASHIERTIHIRLLERGIPIGHGQTFIHLYRFFECRLSRGGERTIDFRIFEISIIRNSQLAIHLCTFQRGITFDSEVIIHGHVALEVRSIFHVQRACVHIALRGNIASASIHAIVCCQLAFRSHIANAIDFHIVFDRSFACSVNAVDSGGALIGGSDSVFIGLNVICIGLDLVRELVIFILTCCFFCSNGVLIGLNVICIRLNLALELGILRFEVSDIALCRCHITLQICDILTVFSDFPFKLCIFSGTRYCLCSNSVRIDLRLCIKCFQVFRNTIRIALLDIVSIFSYLTDAT